MISAGGEYGSVNRVDATARRLGVAAAVVGVLAVVLWILAGRGRRREERSRARLRARLEAGAGRRPSAPASREADLPRPVRRYFEAVFDVEEAGDEREARNRGGTVRIEQSGELRVGGVDSPWHAFTATHHASVTTPGFVWEAVVSMAPGLSVRVRDSFVDGEGSERVTLFGAFPVATSASCPELDEASLQRYLAEAVWYPAALAPENGVVWEPIDDHSARATLDCGETSASLVFHFSRDHLVERVHTSRRYRQVGGRFEPTRWTGLWGAYEEREGVRVPTSGEVVWHLPTGDLSVWRGALERIERRTR